MTVAMHAEESEDSMVARYRTGTQVTANWPNEILYGKPPRRWKVGDGDFARFEIAPGQIVLIGGAPGLGKTALMGQTITEALRFNEDLKVAICNVEMSPESLLERQVARLSGVSLSTITHREVSMVDRDAVASGIATLQTVLDRVVFVEPPFSIYNVLATAEAFGAELIVLDYIQRIDPLEPTGSMRESVNQVMSMARKMALLGVGIIAVSAVSRSKDRNGANTFDASNRDLSAFRESSELEYGADSAWLMNPRGAGSTNRVTLRHLKNRHGEMRDIELVFNKPLQRFECLSSASPQSTGGPSSAASQTALERLRAARTRQDAKHQGQEAEGELVEVTQP